MIFLPPEQRSVLLDGCVGCGGSIGGRRSCGRNKKGKCRRQGFVLKQS